MCMLKTVGFIEAVAERGRLILVSQKLPSCRGNKLWPFSCHLVGLIHSSLPASTCRDFFFVPGYFWSLLFLPTLPALKMFFSSSQLVVLICRAHPALVICFKMSVFPLNRLRNIAVFFAGSLNTVAFLLSTSPSVKVCCISSALITVPQSSGIFSATFWTFISCSDM